MHEPHWRKMALVDRIDQIGDRGRDQALDRLELQLKATMRLNTRKAIAMTKSARDCRIDRSLSVPS